MKTVLILGAAGRDFHNFNVFFRQNLDYQVIAFTVTQIPDIAGRRYPAALAGRLYPEPVISVCAVRTGCGKSPVSRLVAAELRKHGRKPVVIRHPMPYGDLAVQAVQRFARGLLGRRWWCSPIATFLIKT
jgi:predicted GTPase